MIYKVLFWIVTVLILFAALSKPGVYRGGQATNDIYMHFVAFLSFAYLLLRSHGLGNGYALLISILFGGLIELLQFLSGYRVASMLDWYYDSTGSFAGIGLWYLRNRYYNYIYIQ